MALPIFLWNKGAKNVGKKTEKNLLSLDRTEKGEYNRGNHPQSGIKKGQLEMKKFVKLLALTLVASMLLACLASCDASGGIKKAYEEAGYEVKTLNAEDDDVRAILVLLQLDEEEIEEIESTESTEPVEITDEPTETAEE